MTEETDHLIKSLTLSMKLRVHIPEVMYMPDKNSRRCLQS